LCTEFVSGQAFSHRAGVDRILAHLAHLRRTRPGLFPPPRGSPAAAPILRRADADGVLFAQDLPPDV
jgi:hypothetical protein